MDLIIYIILTLSFIWLIKLWIFKSEENLTKKIILFALIGCFVVSQQLRNPSITYPFVNWSMYSSTNPAPLFIEYIIETDEGGKIDYPFTLISKTSPRAFMKEISNLEAKYTRSKQDQNFSNKKPEFEELVESLLNIYSKNYPEQQIIHFEINAVRFKADSLRDKEFERFNYYTHTMD